jgi:DNA processing protein
MPPGCQAFRWSFPARNRLMAGIGTMTVVIEAADPSGSLITAEIAQDLGRPVGAVPGRITARTAAGSNALLRDGAIVITAAEDVLDELFGAGIRPEPRRKRGLPEPALDGRLDAVLAGIEACQPLAVITDETGLPASELRAALAELEALGLIKREGLGRYERCA